MTQWLIEEAVYARHALEEARASSSVESAEPEPRPDPDLEAALERARHFARTGEV